MTELNIKQKEILKKALADSITFIAEYSTIKHLVLCSKSEFEEQIVKYIKRGGHFGFIRLGEHTFEIVMEQDFDGEIKPHYYFDGRYTLKFEDWWQNVYNTILKAKCPKPALRR